MTNKKTNLKTIIKGYLKLLPLWQLYEQAYLARRAGPFLQIILINTSRWDSDINPIAGFEFLGMQRKTVGVLTGDTLRNLKNTQLWLKWDTPAQHVIEFLMQQVRPLPSEPLSLDSAYRQFKRGVEGPGRSSLNNLALFYAALYMGDDATASAAFDKMRSLQATPGELEACKQALVLPREQLKIDMDRLVNENIKHLKLEGI